MEQREAKIKAKSSIWQQRHLQDILSPTKFSGLWTKGAELIWWAWAQESQISVKSEIFLQENSMSETLEQQHQSSEVTVVPEFYT